MPAADGEVLETLPTSLWGSRRTIPKTAADLDRTAANPASAVTTATEMIRLGDESGDPRFYGYARAALRPWWDGNAVPAPILRLRAKLKEKDHRYGDAAQDLQRALVADPNDAQGWIELGNVHRVRGEYRRAMQAAQMAGRTGGPAAAAVARVPVLIATGRTKQATEDLDALLSTDDPPASLRSWGTLMRAEVAESEGRWDDALTIYRGADDSPTINDRITGRHADLLLALDRPDEALRLLTSTDEPHTDELATLASVDQLDNGQLLRLAMAAEAAGRHEVARRWSDVLERRFDAIRRRGDRPHGRFEAFHRLYLRDDPAGALAIAADNWDRQKERLDARAVLEAAIAAGDPAAADDVVRLLDDNDNRDALLRGLIRRLPAPVAGAGS